MAIASYKTASRQNTPQQVIVTAYRDPIFKSLSLRWECSGCDTWTLVGEAPDGSAQAQSLHRTAKQAATDHAATCTL